MRALGGSYLKLFVSRQRERERVGVDFGLCSHDFGFLVHIKRVGDGLVSLRANCVASISTAASAQTGLESEEIQTVSSDQPKTVRVRFKLRKQCAFGQHFLVVGDDPSLGSWDPSDGVPLNWSEGHLWTADVNIPCGKVISYKFVLKEIDGTLSWQPGPDRVLEAWDSANAISVTEDWEIPESQTVHEEVAVDDLDELSLNGSGSLIAENLNQIVGEEVVGDVMEELRVDGSDKPSMLMVAENIGVQDEKVPVLIPGLALIPREETETVDAEAEAEAETETEVSSVVGSQIVEFAAEEAEAETETETEVSSIVGSQTAAAVCDEIVEFAENIGVQEEGFPVLIPGLASIPREETEAVEAEAEAEAEMETEVSSIVGSQTTDVFDETEVSNDPNHENNTIFEDSATESDENEIHASASLHYAEASEVMAAEEKLPRFNGRCKNMESNMQWGRQTLQKFLANLGFMQPS